MQTLADLKVGDSAIVTSNGKTESEVTVIKVARVYLTVTGGREFRIDGGGAKGRNDIGYGTWLKTHDQINARARYFEAVEKLRDRGLEIRHGFYGDFTVETLEAILAAIPNIPEVER